MIEKEKQNTLPVLNDASKSPFIEKGRVLLTRLSFSQRKQYSPLNQAGLDLDQAPKIMENSSDHQSSSAI